MAKKKAQTGRTAATTKRKKSEKNAGKGPQEAKELSGSTEVGEQLDLIDVGPENLKEIAPIARDYKKAQTKRVAALDEEIACKNKIRELVEAAGLKRLPDGTIKFRCDGLLITLTPRDELLKVSEAKE